MNCARRHEGVARLTKRSLNYYIYNASGYEWQLLSLDSLALVVRERVLPVNINCEWQSQTLSQKLCDLERQI